MKSFNWGIIGPGNIAHDFAKDIKLVSVPQTIKAVLSRKEKTGKDFAKEFGIPLWFTNLEEFLKSGNIDIAYIATPHPLHYEQIKACLINKIAVLCEKPIVLNQEQHEELLKLSTEHNTFLMEAMWIRFLPSFSTLLDLLNQKRIGEIIKVKASIHFKAPDDEKNRFYDLGKGGGSLLDLGVYGVFLSTLLLGRPDTIKAIGRLTDKNVDEACSILLKNKDGCYAILESSFLVNHNTPAVIYGTKGIIRISNPWFEKSPGIEIEMNNGDQETIPLSWKGHGFQFQIEEVIHCVSGQKIESDLMPGSLSRDVLAIMDEIRDQINVHYDQYE